MAIQQFIPQSNVLPSANFASLPAASGFPVGWRYNVTDVGTHGSTWASDGALWQLVGGIVNLFQNSIPMGIPPSGIITVTTGVLTLGTALDNIYPSIYFWFPAGAWTGSTAGMYYVVMSSTTVGTVYSNQYTGGVATIPSSPTLVTTGAGAYVQTTGVYNAVLSYTMPAGVMGATGSITSKTLISSNNSTGPKICTPNAGITQQLGNFSLTSGLTGRQGYATSTNVGISRQSTFVLSDSSSSSAASSVIITAVNTAAVFNMTPQLFIPTATDWIILQSYQLILSR